MNYPPTVWCIKIKTQVVFTFKRMNALVFEGIKVLEVEIFNFWNCSRGVRAFYWTLKWFEETKFRENTIFTSTPFCLSILHWGKHSLAYLLTYWTLFFLKHPLLWWYIKKLSLRDFRFFFCFFTHHFIISIYFIQPCGA